LVDPGLNRLEGLEIAEQEFTFSRFAFEGSGQVHGPTHEGKVAEEIYSLCRRAQAPNLPRQRIA
jgi:hypothetical protein